jgi:hypothetical protein
MMHDSDLLEADGTQQKPGVDPKKLRGSRPGKTMYRSRDYQVNNDQRGKENRNDLEKNEKLVLWGAKSTTRPTKSDYVTG